MIPEAFLNQDKSTHHEQINLLNQRAHDIQESDPVRAIKLCEQAHEFSTEVGYTRGLADSLSNLGYLYFMTAEQDLGISTLLEAADLYAQIDDKKGQAAILKTVGHLYCLREQYSMAITFLSNSIALAEEAKSLSLLAEIHQQLSESFKQTGSYEEALFHFELFHFFDRQMHLDGQPDLEFQQRLDEYKVDANRCQKKIERLEREIAILKQIDKSLREEKLAVV